jgi:hypothetical protein
MVMRLNPIIVRYLLLEIANVFQIVVVVVVVIVVVVVVVFVIIIIVAPSLQKKLSCTTPNLSHLHSILILNF